MTKQELQSAMNVELAVKAALKARYDNELISITQFWNLDWHSDERIEALHHVARNCGWILEQ